MTGSSPEERRGRESHNTGSPDVTEKIGTSEPGVSNLHVHVYIHVYFASSMYSCASEITNIVCCNKYLCTQTICRGRINGLVIRVVHCVY